MAGGTGGPYNVGVARSWTIFSVAAATTEGGPAGLAALHPRNQRQKLAIRGMAGWIRWQGTP
ncbi:hypothetical protein C1929_20180 [Stenotrophomonas sp. ZAC14D1_NAIMI4_6]|nr:hypothetical protein C1929_20180 [Stenotrophomonas sp. ZAC14D1_NAIMI4_6]AWH43063.1 hypothetical protein C1927_20180 [Stenotrophomonas sp. ZAC14D1_NAIMI4_1]